MSCSCRSKKERLCPVKVGIVKEERLEAEKSQLPDGRYKFRYTGGSGERMAVYGRKPAKTGKLEDGQRGEESLREKSREFLGVQTISSERGPQRGPIKLFVDTHDLTIPASHCAVTICEHIKRNG